VFGEEVKLIDDEMRGGWRGGGKLVIEEGENGRLLTGGEVVEESEGKMEFFRTFPGDGPGEAVSKPGLKLSDLDLGSLRNRESDEKTGIRRRHVWRRRIMVKEKN
jgi:hypothetical protein